MARQARMAAGGAPHRITQHGNNRQPGFLTDDDRLFFLNTRRHECREQGFSVLGRLEERSAPGCFAGESPT